MITQAQQSLFSSILKLLRPLVRILLRNGIPYNTFADLSKSVYVDVATQEFELFNKKQTTSRVSVLTGLSRKEVSRVRSLPRVEDRETTGRYHRAARVITGWVRDRRFHNEQGEPADLSLEEEEASFRSLVKTFGGDVPMRAILDELLRIRGIERLPNGRIRLLTRAYLPEGDEAGILNILGTDVRDLIQTFDHNLQSNRGESFFQRKVSYDNLPSKILPEFRSLTHSEAQKFLEKTDRWLSSHDRDRNPSVTGMGRYRAGIGIYYFQEAFTEESNI